LSFNQHKDLDFCISLICILEYLSSFISWIMHVCLLWNPSSLHCSFCVPQFSSFTQPGLLISLLYSSFSPQFFFIASSDRWYIDLLHGKFCCFGVPVKAAKKNNVYPTHLCHLSLECFV
jgi:hypothetical protein